MDLSKLSSNEKLAVYGSAAVVLAGLISSWGGLLFLAILAAIGMVVVVFLPQLSASTTLPGTKGTLMAALGIVAAVAAVIAALPGLSLLGFAPLYTVMLLMAVVGAVVMAWAGWQELQAEGGKWQFGSSAPSASGSSAPGPVVDDTPAEGRDEPRPSA